jgi:hypothetical protein
MPDSDSGHGRGPNDLESPDSGKRLQVTASSTESPTSEVEGVEGKRVYVFSTMDEHILYAAVVSSIIMFALSVAMTVEPYGDYDPHKPYDATDGPLWFASGVCWTLFFTLFYVVLVQASGAC